MSHPFIRAGTAAALIVLFLAGPHPIAVATPGTDTDSSAAPSPGEQRTPSRRAPDSAARAPRTATVTPRVNAAASVPRVPTRDARPTQAPAAATAGTSDRDVAAPQRRTAASSAAPASTSASTAPSLTDTVSLTPPARAAAAVSGADATATAPAAATTVNPVAEFFSDVRQCLACWGIGAPSIGQGITTVVNHVFNSAFTWLSSFPANPLSDFLEGGLLLIRRGLFLVPTGVTASQVGTSLTVDVTAGAVAYVRNGDAGLEIAGDPGFLDAQQFSATTVSDVTMSSDLGCAGIVFTEGNLDSGLTATGIDSLRFDATAAFSGAVSATVSSGSLVLSRAVRGLDGVMLDAARIRLADDVEIDAGAGDATFTGAVDGQGWCGGQSLLVTALGTTTFGGDVGSRTPLGSLTTRAIAPLQIPQSADSVTIPLYFQPIYTGSSTEIKYGIDVAIGDSPARRYLFDTGGNGFFSYYTPGYWGNAPLGTEPVGITYTSGAYFDGYATPAVVTIGTGAQTVSTGQPVLVSAVTSASDFFTQGPAQPTNATAYNGPFAGDFGAAFGVQQIGNRPLYTPGSFITSPMFQLPGNLSTGFLVQVGPIGTTPQLTVGLTPELKAQFPYAIPITPNGSGVYPVSGYPLLEQFGIYPTYTVSNTSYATPPSPYTLGGAPLQTIVDTGAGSTNVRLADPALRPFESDKALAPGTVFTATFPTASGKDPLVWQYVVGDNGSVNAVGYTNGYGQAVNGPNVNTGLNLFNDYDVMFDAAGQLLWLRPNGGQSTVILQSVTTKGDQSFGQNAVLNGTYTTKKGDFSVAGVTNLLADAVINARKGNVTFSGTVDAAIPGQASLQVNSPKTTTFTRPVGGLRPLSSLTTDADGTTSAAGVTTTGAQSFGDDVTLFGAYAAGAGGFTVAGTTALSGLTSVQTSGSPITFTKKVDSVAGAGNALSVTAPGGTVAFNAAIGSINPLGGLTIGSATRATAGGALTLDGSLPGAAPTGLDIQAGATAIFANGGTVHNFTGTGVVFEGNSPSSQIRGLTIAGNVYDGILLRGTNYSGTLIADNFIYGNSGFGIETLQEATGLTIRGNVIGAPGTSNQWGYTSAGPNLHGIALGAGNYIGSIIEGNTISYNARNGIFAAGGVQGLQISGNIIQFNGDTGITIAGGNSSGTTITGNTIAGNGADGIALAPGLGQGVAADPVTGYSAPLGHYTVNYTGGPIDFTNPTQIPPDPQIRLTIVKANTTLNVNLDTGSRGLYFDQNSLPGIDLTGSTPGYVYLNSSNRLYFGQWVTTDVVFAESEYVDQSGTDTSKKATANLPVLVVNALGASTTPAPGSATASTTFGTKIASGTVTITNGSQTQQVAIVANPAGGPNSGTVTIPGGWWASYSDNVQPNGTSILASVGNFGVGFDRTGVGTSPTADGTNQEYNAFLSLNEMRNGTMRAGYVISADGVQLGLDSSVSGFAYTDLAPTGLSKGAGAPPDWQPATGSVDYGGTSYDTGPLVIDLGIPTGILTLPGQTPATAFKGPMTVNLLNSGGAVRYTIDGRLDNLLNPNTQQALNAGQAPTIAFFNPLAGAYTQNTSILSQYFFNTGRRPLAAFDYLYDATGGYLGLKVADQPALTSAQGQLAPAFYRNPKLPVGVTNLTISGNTIADNRGNGVSVNGAGSSGNSIVSNSVSGNSGLGIALANGANASQPAPTVSSAQLAGSAITLTGTVTGTAAYGGPFKLQVFSSPASEGANVQGRRLLWTQNVRAGALNVQLPVGGTAAGDWITVTVTPSNGAQNTSEFSAPIRLTG